MELLLQLSTIKSVGKKKMSLLDYVILSIRKFNPSLLNFTNDLVSCETASKIELSSFATRVGEFERSMEKLRKELQKTEEAISALREEVDALEMDYEFMTC